MSSPARRPASTAPTIVIGIVVATTLAVLGWPGSTSQAAGDPLDRPPEKRLEQARPHRGGVADAGVEPGFAGGDRPDAWPDGLAVPNAVRAADERLAASRDALRRTRRGLDAEVSIGPTIDLLARDDPPRPVEAELAWRPKASLSWSPLRSEALLAEARVLEAETDRIAAWRDATLSALRRPVLLAQLHDAVATAERDLATALHRRDTVDAEVEAFADEAAAAEAAAAQIDAAETDARSDRATADELDALERRRADATLDVGEARIELAEAVRELRDLRTGGEHRLPDATAERRPDLLLPELPEATATRAYRARALRLAAEVARSERRWRKAVMPRLGVEVGYAGSDGSLVAELELRDGRPRGQVSGAIGGTPQERGWATVSALFRLGTDLPSAQAEKTQARENERRALAQLAASWRREAHHRWEDARTARARWQIDEARRATVPPDDARGRARALEAARRSWLRYLTALDKVTTFAETWPDISP